MSIQHRTGPMSVTRVALCCTRALNCRKTGAWKASGQASDMDVPHHSAAQSLTLPQRHDAVCHIHGVKVKSYRIPPLQMHIINSRHCMCQKTRVLQYLGSAAGRILRPALLWRRSEQSSTWPLRCQRIVPTAWKRCTVGYVG